MANYQIDISTIASPPQGLQTVVDSYLAALRRIEGAAGSSTGPVPNAASARASLTNEAVTASARATGLVRSQGLPAAQQAEIVKAINAQIYEQYQVALASARESLKAQGQRFGGLTPSSSGVLSEASLARAGARQAGPVGAGVYAEDFSHPRISLSKAQTQEQGIAAAAARADAEYVELRGQLNATIKELRIAEGEVRDRILRDNPEYAPAVLSSRVESAATNAGLTRQVGADGTKETDDALKARTLRAREAAALQARALAIETATPAEKAAEADLIAAIKKEAIERKARVDQRLAPTGGGGLSNIIDQVKQFATFGAEIGLIYRLGQETRQAVQEALALQRAMAELRAQADGLGDSQGVTQFGNQLLGIARATGETGSTVVGVGIQMRGVFGDNAKAAEQTAQIIRASQVTGIALPQVVNLATAAALNYGVSVDAITDKTIGLEQRFGITKNEGLTAFGDVAASAKEAGLSLDQVGGIVGVLNQKLGQGAAASANALDRILPGVQTKTPDILIKAANTPALQASLPQLKDQLNAGETGPALLTLANSWSQLDQVTKNYFLNLLASRRDIPYLNVLLSNSAQVNAEVAKSGQDAGKAAQYQQAQQETLGYQIKRAREEFNQLVEALGKLGVFSALGLVVGALVSGVGALASLAGILVNINNALQGIPGYLIAAVTGVLALTAALKAMQAVSAIGAALKAGITGILARGAGGAIAGEGAAAAGGAAGGGGLLSGIGSGLSGLFAGGGAAGIATGVGALGVGALAIGAVAYSYKNKQKEDAQKAKLQDVLATQDFTTVDSQYQTALTGATGDDLATHVIKGIFNKVVVDKAKGQLEQMSKAGVFSGSGINVAELEATADAGGAKGKLAQAQIEKLARTAGNSPEQKQAIENAKNMDKLAANNGQVAAQTASDLQAQFQSGEISFSAYSAGLQKIIDALQGQTDENSVKQLISAQRTLNQITKARAQALADSSFSKDITAEGADTVKVAQTKAQQVRNNRTRIDPGDDASLFKNDAEQAAADKAVVDSQRTRAQKLIDDGFALRTAQAGADQVLAATIKEQQVRADRAFLDPTDPLAALENAIAGVAADKAVVDAQRVQGQRKVDDGFALKIAQAGANSVLAAQLRVQQIEADKAFIDPTDPNAPLANVIAFIAADKASQDAVRNEGIKQVNLAYDLRIAWATANGATAAAIANIEVERAKALSDPSLLDPTNPDAGAEAALRIAQASASAATAGRSAAADTAGARLDVQVAQAGQNRLLLAELAQQRADSEARFATDEAGKLRAEAARINADRQLLDYLGEAGKAKNELAQAIAASLGDTATVAQLTVDQANAEVARAQAALFFGSGDQAQVDTAQAAAVKAKTSQTEQARTTRQSDLAYLYAVDKITAQQYIASLTLELSQIPESNKAARQAIEQKIFDLRKSLSSNLQFNLGNITLPTFYDAKRLEAGGGVYGTAGANQSNDNRTINIQLNANSSTEVQAGFQQILQALNAAPVTGNRPRTYS